LEASTCSNFWLDTPSTTSEYIWMKRRYESYAKREFLLARSSPTTVRSLSPRLRIVSIMPGMENAAPERTLTSSGFLGSPSFLPVLFSRRARLPSTSARSLSLYFPSRRYEMHSLHAMVNPGGTGAPRFVISARFAPLPPSSRFMSRVPSALPSPKKKTDCVTGRASALPGHLAAG
jgi:hypothetical protein